MKNLTRKIEIGLRDNIYVDIGIELMKIGFTRHYFLNNKPHLVLTELNKFHFDVTDLIIKSLHGKHNKTIKKSN